MKGRLEMGRRLLKSLGSEPGFLRIGETAAVLKCEGTEPVLREEWMMAVIMESSEGRQDKTRGLIYKTLRAHKTAFFWRETGSLHFHLQRWDL